MTRLSLVLAVLAGCAFEGAQGGEPGDDPTGSNDPGSSACAADVDGDGTCDDVDPWLCGPTAPEDPGDTAGGFRADANWNLWNVGFENQRVLSVTAGTPIAYSFDYRATVWCPGGGDGECMSQLELGTPTTLLQCAAAISTENDEIRTRADRATGTLMLAPRAEAYELRLNIGVGASTCPTSYSGTPADDTLAFICVR